MQEGYLSFYNEEKTKKKKKKKNLYIIKKKQYHNKNISLLKSLIHTYIKKKKKF